MVKNNQYIKDNMELMNVKGTRDFLPEEKIFRDKVVAAIKEVFLVYGYNPIETPALEQLSLLSSKYAGGDEILKEIYTLKDQANRKLGLRYDLTVPFARVIAMNKNLPKPFKRCQVERVWRDGPVKLGRYREFWQLDVDIAGSDSIISDAECVGLAQSVFDALGMQVKIEINNRKLLNSIMNYVGIPKQRWMDVILTIDKLEKIGITAVKDELAEKGLSDDMIVKAIDLIQLKGTNEEILKTLGDILGKSADALVNELKDLLKYARLFGAKDVIISPSLARGLAFYTGTVFEVYLKSRKIKSSLAAGGRYDEIIGKFSGKDEPCVGISFGLDVIADAAKAEGKLKPIKTETRVFVIPIKTIDKVISIVTKLRNAGIRTDFDIIGRSISKNLDYADRMGIPYALIVGEQELKKKKLKLKDMNSGKEQMLTIEQVIKKLAQSL